VASWSREAGDTVLVKTVGRTVARVSAEEHMANYRAARALMGKGKSSAKKGAKKSAVSSSISRLSEVSPPLGAIRLSARRWIRILEKNLRQLFSTAGSTVRFPDSSLQPSDLGERLSRMSYPNILDQLSPRCASEYVFG